MNFAESPEETAQVKSATGPGVGMGQHWAIIGTLWVKRVKLKG